MSAVGTPAGVLAAAESLAPSIAARAPEVEAARRLPKDLLDELVDIGCFRLLLPTSHGGTGADLPTALRLFETLARADGSVGWTVMIGGGSWIDLASLPRPSFDALFAGRSDVITAGAINPSGRITVTDDGYLVEGRWAFASGCEHATWLFGNCIEGMGDHGPLLRVAVLDPVAAVIEDTWDVVGLRGTGSHHFHIDGVVVPADCTYALLQDEPCLDEPIVRVPPPQFFGVAVASVALGMAQGALDDIKGLAPDRIPLLADSALAGSPHFHLGLAQADTDVRAARALLTEEAHGLWSIAVEGRELTLAERARSRATAVWATDRAAQVVEFAYRSGGSAALYSDCSLQRRLRDVQTLRQHFVVRGDTMQTAGSLLAGQELHAPIF